MYSFWDVSKKGKLLPKNQIKHRIGTPLPWFEYQQFFYLYWHLTSQGKMSADLSRFGQLLVAQPLPIKGLLSAVYSCLTDKELPFSLGYLKAWHLDLGKSIPKEA